MNLTKKVGVYLCTAAMVFSLNVKSNAWVKETIQVLGMTFEAMFGTFILHSEITQKFKNNNNADLVWGIIFGGVLDLDFFQRFHSLVFGDDNSKTKKTDNKELNKKNEKKVENA